MSLTTFRDIDQYCGSLPEEKYLARLGAGDLIELVGHSSNDGSVVFKSKDYGGAGVRSYLSVDSGTLEMKKFDWPGATEKFVVEAFSLDEITERLHSCTECESVSIK